MEQYLPMDKLVQERLTQLQGEQNDMQTEVLFQEPYLIFSMRLRRETPINIK